MVASLNAAAKSDRAHESDVLLAWHQTNIWTAAYKESFLSILRAVWTKLEYCSYFLLWFISLRHLESALTVQQNPRLGQIPFSWSVTSGEKFQSRGKVWKEDRSCWWGQRERNREGREINAGDDMSKLNMGKERRYQEVQSQIGKES